MDVVMVLGPVITYEDHLLLPLLGSLILHEPEASPAAT